MPGATPPVHARKSSSQCVKLSTVGGNRQAVCTEATTTRGRQAKPALNWGLPSALLFGARLWGTGVNGCINVLVPIRARVCVHKYTRN